VLRNEKNMAKDNIQVAFPYKLPDGDKNLINYKNSQ
jgi:hypothetical protein